MAHISDHKIINTNSNLAFSTIDLKWLKIYINHYLEARLDCTDWAPPEFFLSTIWFLLSFVFETLCDLEAAYFPDEADAAFY